jgi:tetratricopeptide (TPR) repeat protein
MSDVWLQLAAVYERRGMPAAALEAYKEIIGRNPKDPAALTGAAGALVQLRRFDEARAHAELAVDVAPAIAHELLARLALQRGDADAARRHAKLAFDADPTLPMPQFVEGLIAYGRGDFAGAVPHLTQASQALAARTERVADVNYLLGDSLARLERYPEAEAAFKAELAVFPAHLRARGGLAMLYAATGRAAEAAAQVEELMRISPTPAGYEAAAQLWTMFGQPQRAAAARARAR